MDKKFEMVNCYRVLGVSPKAHLSEIERAYRRLVRQYHPDTGGVTASVERFAEVRAAWAVLSDPVRKREHDRKLVANSKPAPSSSGPATSRRSQQHASPWNSEPAKPGGKGEFQQLFRKVFRQRYQKADTSTAEDGRDIQVRVELDLETAFRGGRQRIRLPKDIHHPQRQLVEVDIPACVRHEQVLRFPALGFPGVGGGQAGDLLVKVLIRPHARMQLEGRDLLYHLPVWPWELMLGATIEFEALGERLSVQIPAGTSSRTRLRLHGKGYGPAPRGDLLVLVEVCTPEPGDIQKRQLLQQLAQAYQDEPRK